MKLEARGKTLPASVLTGIVSQNEARAERIEWVLPRIVDGNDLSALTLTMYGYSEEHETKALQVLAKSVTADAVTAIWDIAAAFTAVSGQLTLELWATNAASSVIAIWYGDRPVEIRASVGGVTALPPSIVDQVLGQVLDAAGKAKDSETNAKKSEVAAASSAAASQNQADNAKAQADRSKNEADRSKGEANRSEAAADVADEKAKLQVERAKAEANRSKTEADRSKSEADRAAHAAGFDPADYYGAEEGTRLEREKANWDAGTQTGERFITLPPCESTTAAVKVYGSTAQKTSAQGKNLWGGTTQWPLIKQGVTVSYDAAADEYILNGTFGATDGWLGTINLMPYTVTAGQKLTLTVYNVSGSMTGQLILIARLLKSTAPIKAVTSGRRVEFSIVSDVPSRSGMVTVTQEDAQEAAAMEMKLWTNAAPITYTNYRFKVQVEIGEKTAWERFTPHSPSPDYPAPMKGVGESGALEVAACGKNLWGGTTQWPTTTRGVTLDYDPVTDEYTANGTLSGAGTLASIGKIPFQAVKGQKITLSTYKVSGTMTGHIMPCAELLDAAGGLTPRALVEGWVMAEATSASFSYIVTDAAAENTTRLYMSIWLSDYLLTTFTNYRFKVQLEVGEKTAWERFTPQSVRTPLTAPLYSLPSGVRDTVDIESGTITRRIGKRTFTGEETFLVLSDGSASIARFSCKVAFLKKTLTEIIVQSSHFRPARLDSWGVEESVSAGEHTYNRIDFNFHKARLTGWSDSLTGAQKLALFKAWLAANPVTVLYELETPTEERIDPALLPVYVNGTTLYSPDAVPPPLEATVLDPRPVSAARSLSGYAARQMESKADKSWVDSALEGKANNAPVDILPFSLDPRFIGTSTCVYWKNEFGEINVQIRCKSNGAISSPVNLGTLPVGFRPRFEVTGPAIIRTSSSGWILSVTVLRTDGGVQLWAEVSDEVLPDVIVSIGLIPT